MVFKGVDRLQKILCILLALMMMFFAPAAFAASMDPVRIPNIETPVFRPDEQLPPHDGNLWCSIIAVLFIILVCLISTVLKRLIYIYLFGKK